jgi:hypothetical protein
MHLAFSVIERFVTFILLTGFTATILFSIGVTMSR